MVGHNAFSNEMKECLLKLVVDDITFKAIKKEHKVNEAFDENLSNIIIATRGEY